MCCFSGNVDFVRGTRIFARTTEPGRQAVVYQMEFGAKLDLAMILPLPVLQGSGEKALHFIDLSKYPAFFTDLSTGFQVVSYGRSVKAALPAPAGKTLEVKQVGNFEASYVPTVKDFARLDARFKLPEETWQALPQYADHGFAVFKLRKGEHEVHPMAFTFPTRHDAKLFFPTVHIHDGKVHAEEDFDHVLYSQVYRAGLFAMMHWEESEGLAKSFMKGDSKNLIDPERHVYRRKLQGRMKNEDIIIAAA